jgi:hypothetical protein
MPLASGSFGTVYPGYYYDDPVAVKLLRVGLGEDEAALRSRMLKEVQLQVRRGLQQEQNRRMAAAGYGFAGTTAVQPRCKLDSVAPLRRALL